MASGLFYALRWLSTNTENINNSECYAGVGEHMECNLLLGFAMEVPILEDFQYVKSGNIWESGTILGLLVLVFKIKHQVGLKA